MTVPGGVPNLPAGALTLETLSSNLEDMSGTAMKARAVGRMPSIFNSSTGLDPALDITPFGILTRIWAEVNSLIATADPADINGPEDLPQLLLQFIEGLPLVGQFVGLVEAILGTYDGDDEMLLTIQQIFSPIRAFVGLFGHGVPVGSLTTAQPNQLPDGDFPDGSIPENSGGWWINLSFSAEDDDTGVGEITADNTLHQLVSDKIAVGQGQNITVLINVAHPSATTSGLGPPVVIRLLRFNGDTELAPIELITYTPNTPTVAMPGVTLTGKYKVPAGVTDVEVLAEVNENATSGLYRFDKGRLITEADISTFPGVQQGLQAVTQQFDELLKGIAGVAKGIPILDKIGVDDAMLLFAQWNPLQAVNQLSNVLALATGALLGKPVTSATAEDFANALAVANNIPGVDETTYVTETITAAIPAFADKFDAVAVGRGQRGRNGGFIGIPVFGQGGAPGLFASATWEDGVHYTKGVTEYTVEFLSDGSAKVSMPGGHSFTAAAGSGTLGTNPLGGYQGRGPGQVTYNGKPYTGGSNQTSPGAKGISPGGGGAGGRAGLGGNEAGDGGDPAAWVRFRADSVVVDDESTGTDTTPPTAPTIFEVESRTFDSLTFKVGGSVDA